MFLAPDAVTAITKLTIVRTSTHQLPGWHYRSGRSPDWLKFRNPEARVVKPGAEEDGADETLPEKVPRQRELMLSCLTTIERKYSGTQSERWEEVPELEQWNGEFWRPNREFFLKEQGILGQNREFDLGSHAKIRGQVTPTSRRPPSDTLQLAARSLDRSTRSFPSSRHCWRAPCIPSCGPAFDRSAASHQPGAHLTL